MKRVYDPVFNEFIVVSPKQVELAIYIRQFRKIHNLSQKEMAELCSLYGKDNNISFKSCEIWFYENYKRIPTKPKFQVLMNTMDITPDML